MPPNDDPLTLARAIRRYAAAVLLRDELAERVRFVISPAGHFVIAADPGLENAEEIVAHVPEEAHDAVQVMFETATPIDRAVEADADRYLAAHGEPADRLLYRLRPHAAKLEGHVFDGSEIRLENPLAREIGPLLREWNRAPGRIIAACRGAVRVAPISPVIVGVDPLGADVRASLGIIRLEFDTPAASASSAGEMLARFASTGGWTA